MARTTITLSEEIRRYLKIRAAKTDKTVSQLIREAVELQRQEEAEDEYCWQLYKARKNQPNIPWDVAMRQLQKR